MAIYTPRMTLPALEKKIEELEQQRQRIQQSTDNLSNHQIDFGTALNAVMKFIENPHDAWVRGNLKQKKLVQRLVFARPIAIHPSQPIGTADLSLPFKMLKENISGKKQLVGYDLCVFQIWLFITSTGKT